MSDKKIITMNKNPENIFCPFMGTQVVQQQDAFGKMVVGITPIACMEIACKFYEKDRKCKIEDVIEKIHNKLS